MAERDTTRLNIGPLQIRTESGKLFKPAEIAETILNMDLTEENTLRSIQGPCSYSQVYSIEMGALSGPTLEHGRMHGIFHCVLFGYDDMLLIHVGDEIKRHQGWRAGSSTQNWYVLLGPAADVPQLEANMADDTRPRWPTQFCATPNGVVIVPQDGRPYFYDGRVVAPLGFSSPPGTPIALGPQSTQIVVATDGAAAPNTNWSVPTNDSGYHHDGATTTYPNSDGPGCHAHFKGGRLGLTRSPPGMISEAEGTWGVLEPAEFQYAFAWVDQWGNISAISPRSNTVRYEKEVSLFNGVGTTADTLRKQNLVTSLHNGPEGTIGKILYRTKDLLHSGSAELWEIPQNAGDSLLGFATIPDNLSDVFPDNIPDTWLVRQAPRTIPVPRFKLCCLAFGRLFVANVEADGGIVRWSMPGKWGTFTQDDYLYPDPTAGSVSALHAVSGGLLVFTDSSIFMLSPSLDSRSFQYKTISSQVGCVAPNSVKTMPNGMTVFLSAEGFYAFQEGEILPVGEPLRAVFKQRINKSRLPAACAAIRMETGEYLCYVAELGGESNNLGFVFDGQGWKRRNDVAPVDICTTRDHRKYVLAAGKSDGTFRIQDTPPIESADQAWNGVWVLDHENWNFIPDGRTAAITTAWLQAPTSYQKNSPLRVKIWLREYSSAKLTVNVKRDWRDTSVNTVTVDLHPEEDPPPFWDTAQYSTSGDTWKRRRPYWVKGDIYVPACEVFKLALTRGGHWEFVALQIEDAPRASSARMTP